MPLIRILSFVLLALPSLLLAQERVWDDRFTRRGIVADHYTRFSSVDDSTLEVIGLRYVNGASMLPAAKFNGSTFEPIGNYKQSMYLRNMVAWRGERYAAGSYVHATRGYQRAIFRLTANEWTPILHANGELKLLPYDSTLYVFGNFDSLDGKPANRIASYNGEQVMPLEHGLSFAAGSSQWGIHSLYPIGDKIYVTGIFSRSDSIRFRNIYSFDPRTNVIHTLDTGSNGSITSLASWRGKIYAVGDFTEIGGVGAFKFAKWDGLKWSPVGAPRDLVSHSESELLVYNDELLLRGSIISAGALRPRSIAVWNGSAWSDKYDVKDRRIGTVAIHGGKLIAMIDSAGYHLQIATYDDSAWRAIDFPDHGAMLGLLPSQYDEPHVYAMAATSQALYVAGFFMYIKPDGDTIRDFAYFDGDKWEAIDDTLPAYGQLYANGQRLFYTNDGAIGELVGGKLKQIASFPNYGSIADVTFSKDEVIVAMYDLYEPPTDFPTLYTASLKDLEFSGHEIYRSLRTAQFHKGKYYCLAPERLMSYSAGITSNLWPFFSDDQYFSDMILAQDTVYLTGRFTSPEAPLAKRAPNGARSFVGDLGQDYFYQSRSLVRIGKKTFVSGELGYVNNRYSSMGFEEGGKFTNMFEINGNDLMVEFKGDLYLPCEDGVDNVQSSGIARLMLSAPAPVRHSVSEDARMIIYPNPASTTAHLSAPCIAIYDCMGRLAMQVDPNDQVINVAALLPGSYYARTQEGLMHRFLVMR